MLGIQRLTADIPSHVLRSVECMRAEIGGRITECRREAFSCADDESEFAQHPKALTLSWVVFVAGWWISAVGFVPQRNKGAVYVSGAVIVVGAVWSIRKSVVQSRSRRLERETRDGSESDLSDRRE
jgi:hypothetical protein